MPRLKKTVENTATTIVGVSATPLNSRTRRTCRRAPAEPRRRSTHMRVSRPASTAPSSRRETKFASTRANTWLGGGNSRVSITKVTTPRVSAKAASSRVTPRPIAIMAMRPSGVARGTGVGASGMVVTGW